MAMIDADFDAYFLDRLMLLEMDLPIMTSADDSLLIRGITHGAYDYLANQVKIEEPLGETNDFLANRVKIENQVKVEKPLGETKTKIMKRKIEEIKEEQGESAEKQKESHKLKKTRVVWSQELHQEFVAVYDKLGEKKAVPKKILEMMNHSGLTRENVGSHLQKYRLSLKKEAEDLQAKKEAELQQQGRIDVPNARDGSFRAGRNPPRTLAANGLLNSTAQPASSCKSISGGILQGMDCPCGSCMVDIRNIGQPKQMGQPYGCPGTLQSTSSFPGYAFHGQFNESPAMHIYHQPSPSMHLPGQPLSAGHYANVTGSQYNRNSLIIGPQMPKIDISNHVSAGGIGTNPNTFATNYANSLYDAVTQGLHIDVQNNSLDEIYAMNDYDPDWGSINKCTLPKGRISVTTEIGHRM